MYHKPDQHQYIANPLHKKDSAISQSPKLKNINLFNIITNQRRNEYS